MTCLKSSTNPIRISLASISTWTVLRRGGLICPPFGRLPRRGRSSSMQYETGTVRSYERLPNSRQKSALLIGTDVGRIRIHRKTTERSEPPYVGCYLVALEILW